MNCWMDGWFCRESLAPPGSMCLPVNSPPASGDHAVTPKPRSAAIGSRSRSGVRSIKLYSIRSPANEVHPRSSASVLALATSQAGMLQTPA